MSDALGVLRYVSPHEWRSTRQITRRAGKGWTRDTVLEALWSLQSFAGRQRVEVEKHGSTCWWRAVNTQEDIT